MKKYLFFILYFLLVEKGFAQFAVKLNPNNEFSFAKEKIKWQRNKAVFVNNLFVYDLGYFMSFHSVNFDMRFKKNQNNGLGFNMGLGGRLSKDEIEYINDNFIILDTKALYLPVGINYLFGTKEHHIELGIKLPIISEFGEAIYSDGTKKDEVVTTLGFFPEFGYRYQSKNKKLFVNASWNPVIDFSGFELSGFTLFSLGIGYNFNSFKPKVD